MYILIRAIYTYMISRCIYIYTQTYPVINYRTHCSHNSGVCILLEGTRLIVHHVTLGHFCFGIIWMSCLWSLLSEKVPGTQKTNPTRQEQKMMNTSNVGWNEDLIITFLIISCAKTMGTDGKNPAPVDMVNIHTYPHYLQGAILIPGGCLGFLPSATYQRSSEHFPEASFQARRLDQWNGPWFLR